MLISHEFTGTFALSSRSDAVRTPLQERLRGKLRHLVERSNVQLRILGERLGLSPSGVGRILNEEGYNILIPHIEGFCEFFQISPAELFVEQDAMIQPIKPLELQLLKHFRQMTELQRHSLLAVLDRPEEPKTRRRARPGHVELTSIQQLVVDLFVKSEADDKEAVLKLLRGTAKRAAEARRAALRDSGSER